jgi:uncharacterized protein
LMTGDDHVVVGMKNKAQALAGNVMPEPVKAAMQAKQTEPDAPKEENR